MTSDKTYSNEQRLNQLRNNMGPAPAGTGNGQRQTLDVTANQTILSTTPAVVGANSVPLSWAVVAGKWYLYAEITYVPALSAGNASLRLTLGGGAATNLRASFWMYAPGVGAQLYGQVTAMDTDMQSSTMTAGTTSLFVVSATMNLGGAATLSLTARTSVAADTYVIQSYSFGTLESVGQTS